MPEKRFFPGIRAQLNRWELICSDQRHFFQNAARFAVGLHFVCEMCARPEGFVREFRRAMASLAAIFPTDHLLSGPPLFGTLSAHRPGHDVAKHAIRRHGLADAGSSPLVA